MLRFLAVACLFALASACGTGGGSTPQPTPAIAPLGQTVDYEQISLTVTSAERTEQIGEASVPGSGNRFLVVDVRVNNQTTHKISYSRYQFTVVADDGRSFDALAVPGQERPLLESELEPQKDVSGTIVFRIPANVGPLLLRYGAPGLPAPIRVDLGS